MADEQRLDNLEKSLSEHMDLCRQEFDAGRNEFDRLERCINENTAAVRALAEQTAGIIKLHQDIEGAARIGIKVQRIAAWFVKWPLIIAGCWAAVKAIVERIGS